MSKLIRHQLTLAPEMEDALRELANSVQREDDGTLVLPVQKEPFPGLTFTLTFAEGQCTAKLTPWQSTRALKEKAVKVFKPKLSTLAESAGLKSSYKKAVDARTTKAEQRRVELQGKIRQKLIGGAKSVDHLILSLRLSGKPGAKQAVWRAVSTMDDVITHRGKRPWLYQLKGTTAIAPTAKRVVKRTSKRVDPGVSPEPLTVKPGTSGPRNAVAKNAEELKAGAENVERLVVTEPVCRNMHLARVDGFWKKLYQEFGNRPMTAKEAAEVLKGDDKYTARILRHMCYLGCADNLPREHKRSPRQFFLLGSMSDPTRDLANRYNGKGGAATSEPPPTVTKRPTVAAALRARRAKA